jgi:hypothetical protein
LVPIDQLKPYSRNAKRHDQAQVAKIAESIRQFGFTNPILIDEHGEILAGHGRYLAAQQIGLIRVPCVRITHLSRDQKEAYRLVDNRLAELSRWDESMLVSVMADLTIEARDLLIGWSDEELMKFLDEYRAEGSALALKADPYAVPGSRITTYAEDVIFPTTDTLGIPELRGDRLARPECVRTLQTWAGQSIPSRRNWCFVFGSNKAPEGEGGILSFFTDDTRFERLWDDAVRMCAELVRQRWDAVMAPDFSLWLDMPVAVQIYNVYRSRWCARYWQEAGLTVIPTVSWSHEQSFDYCFRGLKPPVPLIAVQCRTVKTPSERSRWIKGCRAAVETLAPSAVLVYGGITNQDWLELGMRGVGTEMILMDSWTDARRATVWRKGGAT